METEAVRSLNPAVNCSVYRVDSCHGFAEIVEVFWPAIVTAKDPRLQCRCLICTDVPHDWTIAKDS